MLVEGTALQGGLLAGCSPDGPVVRFWCAVSTWDARAGARLHRRVFRACLSWESGRLALSLCYLAGGVICDSLSV